MLNSLNKNQQIKLINTINKMLFDVNSVLQKENDESFEIGVRLKTDDEQTYLFTVFTTIFNDHDNIKIVAKKDDDDKLIVCIVRD
jgi:hypothetical protein